MLALIIGLTLATGSIASEASASMHHHHASGRDRCVTRKCKRREWRKHHRLERVYGQTYSARATYYSDGPCDSGSGGGETTSLGTHVHFGEVAQSTLPLPTNIEVSPPIHGRRDFTIEDRFGSPQAPGRLDVFMSCDAAAGWNNPKERWRPYTVRWVRVKG